jgi:hypothetical protein
MLAGAAAGSLLALIRPRTPTIRMLGAVAVLAAIAYLFTPLTAAGPDGQPTAFTINFRYALAALALGLALLPLWRPLAGERVRMPGLGRELPGDLVRSLLLAGGLAALAVTSQLSDSAYIWSEPFTSIPSAALIGAVLIAAPVGLALLGRRSVAVAWVAAGGFALSLVAVGWERQDDYLDHRYAGGEGFQFQLDDAVRWADRRSSLRIGVAGTSGAYNQYGFYGEGLDNHVQYIGDEQPGGDFRAIEKCAPWRRAVNEGDYDFVITTPGLDLNAPAITTRTPERGWLARDPNATLILHSGRVAAFRLNGALDPDGCGRRAREGPPLDPTPVPAGEQAGEQ